MRSKERFREVFQSPPEAGYWNDKTGQGWKLVAAEWEREAGSEGEDVPWVEEVPFGLRVAEDCLHLVENPQEKEAMTLMLELIVADNPFSEIADQVNARGFRTRSGSKWTQIDIFELLPRLVEVSSRIYPTRRWSERRGHIYSLFR